MKYVLYRIKKNKEQQWIAWCHELATTCRDEALKTLKEENLAFEGFLTLKIEETFYAVGYCHELEGGEQPTNKENKLNQRHSMIKQECLEFVSKDKSDYFLRQ